MMQLISLVIPAYNEAARITTTVLDAAGYFQARQQPCEIIVAADGTDGTREAAQRLMADHPNVRVIGSPERRGKGHGIRQAVRLAQGDIVGFSDGDHKTPISEFAEIEPHLRAGADVVIGSRGLPDSRVERPQPFYRRVGSRGFGVFMHAVVGLPGIIDTQCGFKFFQGEVARDLFRRQVIDGYMFDVEILFIARQLGYRIDEVPVRWRDDRDSRLNLVRGNVRNVRDIFGIRWHHRQLRPESRLVSEPASRSEP